MVVSTTSIGGTPEQIATRGNPRYQQRIRVYKNQLKKDPAFINNTGIQF